MKKKKPVRKVLVDKPVEQPASKRTKAEKNAQFAEAYGGKAPAPPFEYDHRKTNPGLHRLYVEWAVRHMALFDQVISAFGSEANLNMLDATWAVINERAKLIKTNAAYAEAEKLINIYKSVKPFQVSRTVQFNAELDKG